MRAEDLVTNAVIEAALAADRGVAAKLLSWNFENCSKKGDNFTNEVKRIQITFNESGKKKATSYIVKLSPCLERDPHSQYRNRAMKKEAFFFSELVHLLNQALKDAGVEPLSVSACYFTSCEEGKEVIVLEDLTPYGFISKERSIMLDENHCQLMAKEIARFHAASFHLMKKYSFTELSKLYPLLEETLNLEDPEFSRGFNEVFKKGLFPMLTYAKNDSGSQELVQCLENMYPRAVDALKKTLTSTPKWRVLCHGDFHRTNCLFKYNEDDKPIDAAIIDWQTFRIADIGTELNYMSFGSYTTQCRDHLMPGFEECYYNFLTEFLGQRTEFTLSELRSHIAADLYGFLMISFLLPSTLILENDSELFYFAETEEKQALINNAYKERVLKLLKCDDVLITAIREILDGMKKRKVHEVL